MPCLLCDDAREQQHRNQVRYRHQRVQNVRDGPHKVERQNGAEHNDREEQQLVRQNRLSAEQILRRPLAVVRPAEDGRVGEGDNAEHKDGRADVRDLRERDRGHLTAVGDARHIDRRVLHDSRDEHETGHKADNDRRPERAGRGDERLTHRIARLRGGCNERRGAHAGLVREQTARHAVLERETDAAADQTARDRARPERKGEDCLERRENVVEVDAEDDDAAEHIEQRHDRNQLFAHGRDSFDAAEDDDSGDDAEHDADGDARNADGQVGLDDLRDGVDLRAAAGAEGRQHGKQREQNRHHLAELLPFQAALKCIHRAAHHAAVCGLHAVLDRDQALRVLGRDAEHTGQPAPQHRARAAEIDGRAHADDVARADGGRKRGRQRLKLADVARGVRVLRHRQPDAGERLFLDKSGAQRHKNMRAAQQNEHRCAPYPVSERGDKARESLHVFLSPFFRRKRFPPDLRQYCIISANCSCSIMQCCLAYTPPPFSDKERERSIVPRPPNF